MSNSNLVIRQRGVIVTPWAGFRLDAASRLDAADRLDGQTPVGN